MKISSSASKYIKKRNAIIILIVASLLSIALVPITGSKTKIVENLQWVGLSILITESLFVIGLGLMAYEAGHELGKNPLLWRKKLHHVITHILRTRLFWTGFWINTAGAIGTAVVIAIGIITSLPPESWGLLWLSVLDLSFTITIRAAAIISLETAK